MRVRRTALIALFATAVAPAAAQWAGWDYDFDEEKKSWQEIQAQIPAYPRNENLIALRLGGATGHTYYVDANSVSRGEDGVMRYTAVVRTSGGATNVSFEGMRCETREQKIYAFGRTDGTWVRARNPKWAYLAYQETTPHYGMLFRDYFCPSRFRLPRPKDVVGALRSGRPLQLTTQESDD